MIFMKRNLQEIHYCVFASEEPVYDDEGYETGEKILRYEEPQSLMCNVGVASGEMVLALFGTTDPYDKIIMTDKMDIPIDETTALFIDKEPEFDDDGIPKGDHIIKRCGKTLNHRIFAVKKVT